VHDRFGDGPITRGAVTGIAWLTNPIVATGPPLAFGALPRFAHSSNQSVGRKRPLCKDADRPEAESSQLQPQVHRLACMSTLKELAAAQRAVELGNYQHAIRRLWNVEAWARDDPRLAGGLHEVASELVQRTTTGEIHTQAEELKSLAEAHIARLEVSPPETPPFRVGMPVSTSNDVPGWQVTDYIGEVFGLVVRSRGAGAQIGANLKSVIGGELNTMTNLLRDTRK
jgi:hypothetical protein